MTPGNFHHYFSFDAQKKARRRFLAVFVLAFPLVTTPSRFVTRCTSIFNRETEGLFMITRFLSILLLFTARILGARDGGE